MTYYVGDKPADDYVIEPARDLAEFNTAVANLIGPNGVLVESLTAVVDHDDDAVKVTWPSTSPFADPGLYQLRITLKNDAGASERLPAVPIVVQDDTDGWLSLDAAREVWPDAENLTDRTLFTILDTAKRDVLAFAPALADGAPVPLNYTEAQKLHARDIWNSGTVDSGGQFGEGAFTVRPFPLDWMVKQILRPKRGMPAIQ